MDLQGYANQPSPGFKTFLKISKFNKTRKYMSSATPKMRVNLKGMVWTKLKYIIINLSWLSHVTMNLLLWKGQNTNYRQPHYTH